MCELLQQISHCVMNCQLCVNTGGTFTTEEDSFGDFWTLFNDT